MYVVKYEYIADQKFKSQWVSKYLFIITTQ